MITTRGKTVISLFTGLLAEHFFQQNTLIHSLLEISGGVLVFSGLFCFWETEREQEHLCCLWPSKWNGQDTKQLHAICILNLKHCVLFLVTRIANEKRSQLLLELSLDVSHLLDFTAVALVFSFSLVFLEIRVILTTTHTSLGSKPCLSLLCYWYFSPMTIQRYSHS